MEKATRRRVSATQVKDHRNVLLRVANEHISYIPESTETAINDNCSRINTAFFVDHSELPERIKKASETVPWELGDIPAGWEWIAFTFFDQTQMELTADEIEVMLAASDDMVRHAYARMTLDTSHKWASYGTEEVEFIVNQCQLKPDDAILDVGCGNGRHSVLLASR
jgi:hypothetical protein